MSHDHQPLTSIVRLQSIELLNHNLSSAIDLHSQFKTALWNVQINGNTDIRNPIEAAAKIVSEIADIMAEHINSLDGAVLGTIQFATENSTLIPYNIGIAGGKEHGFALCASLAAYSQSLTTSIATCTKSHDFSSANILTNILRAIDKSLRNLSLKIATNYPDDGDTLRDNRHQSEKNHTPKGQNFLEKVI